jgi:AraC-like DNA-binding protein
MKPLRERLTPQMIDDLKHRRVTDAQLAEQLGVNEKYLNYVFNSVLKQRRIRGKVSEKRENERKLVLARRQMRIKQAKKVLNGRISLEKAAKDANCSTRTMRRYVERVAPQIAEQAYE